MVLPLYKLDFKKLIIRRTLALIRKWEKLLPLRYFSLKHVHSSAKLPALQMTYWRNNLLFLYFRFIVFSTVTLSIGSFMSEVSKQHPVFGYFILFSQNIQPDLDWKYRNYMTRRLKKLPRKYSTFLGQRKLWVKNKEKFSGQLVDVMPTSIYFTIYRSCCSQVFYRKFPKIPWNTPVIGNYISKAIFAYLV